MKGFYCSALLLVNILLVCDGLKVMPKIQQNDPCKYVQDNVFIDNPASCKSYFKCVNGKAAAHDCPNDLYFNKLRGTCDLQSSVSCEEKPVFNPCANADKTFVNDPKSCESFFYCNNGVPESYDCPDGLVFNPDKRECVYPHTYSCDDKAPPPKPIKICEGIPNGVFIRDAADCAKFYVCVQEVETPLTCAAGAYFNLRTATCDVAETVECEHVEKVVSTCDGVASGAFVKNATSCSGWVQCIDGESKNSGACPKDQWFVDSLGACNWWWLVTEADCKNRCEGKMYGFVVAPGTGCKEYYNCKDGKLNSDKMACADDLVFDINNEHCVPESMSSKCLAP